MEYVCTERGGWKGAIYLAFVDFYTCCFEVALRLILCYFAGFYYIVLTASFGGLFVPFLTFGLDICLFCPLRLLEETCMLLCK